MATGYTRQSSAQIVDGQVINASDFNNEFDLIRDFASGTTGHDHSGGTGLGPPISLTLTNTGVTGVLDAKFGGIHTAAADPTATDDTPDYAVGSIWINTITKAVFRCTDNTSTAAVWTKQQATSSASDPTVNSDIDQGYVVGSVWYNTSTQSVMVCVDNTNGAAVWLRVVGFRSASDPTVNSDVANGYVVGSTWYNTSTKSVMVCIDNTSGAAVWVRVVGVTSASYPTVNDDIDGWYGRGTIWHYTGVSPTVTLVCVDNTNGAAVWYPLPRGRLGVITGATTIPTVNEDSTVGYAQGSLILNSTQGTFYICTSASAGAATWKSLAYGRTGVSASAPTATDDINKGYLPGSVWVETTTPNIYVCVTNTANSATWATVTFNLGLIALAAQVFGRA